MDGIRRDYATGENVSARLCFLRGIAKELIRDLTHLEADIEKAIEESRSYVHTCDDLEACEDLELTLSDAVSVLVDMADCYSSWCEVWSTHFMNDDKEIAPAITHKGNDIIALSELKE